MFQAVHQAWEALEDWAVLLAAHQAWEPAVDWVFQVVHRNREPQMELAVPRTQDPGPVIPLARAQRAATNRSVEAMPAASIQARRPMAKVTEEAWAWDP